MLYAGSSKGLNETRHLEMLENAIERAVVLSKSRTLNSEDFAFLSKAVPSREGTPTLKLVEQEYIIETLENCDWNITHAAKILGINRVTLHKKINRYGFRKNQK